MKETSKDCEFNISSSLHLIVSQDKTNILHSDIQTMFF